MSEFLQLPFFHYLREQEGGHVTLAGVKYLMAVERPHLHPDVNINDAHLWLQMMGVRTLADIELICQTYKHENKSK